MDAFFTIGKKLLKDESGATAIEYGLLAALISVVIIGAVGAIGTTLNAKFTDVSTKLNNPPATSSKSGN